MTTEHATLLLAALSLLVSLANPFLNKWIENVGLASAFRKVWYTVIAVLWLLMVVVIVMTRNEPVTTGQVFRIVVAVVFPMRIIDIWEKDRQRALCAEFFDRIIRLIEVKEKH